MLAAPSLPSTGASAVLPTRSADAAERQPRTDPGGGQARRSVGDAGAGSSAFVISAARRAAGIRPCCATIEPASPVAFLLPGGRIGKVNAFLNSKLLAIGHKDMKK